MKNENTKKELTLTEIRAAFREMRLTGGDFLRNLGWAGLYADESNRNKIVDAFRSEIETYAIKAEAKLKRRQNDEQ